MDLGDIIFKPIVDVYLAADKFVEDKTGKGLLERGNERLAAEEVERRDQPLKWTAKKVAKGTIKGLFSAVLHGDL